MSVVYPSFEVKLTPQRQGRKQKRERDSLCNANLQILATRIDSGIILVECLQKIIVFCSDEFIACVAADYRCELGLNTNRARGY